MKKWFSLLLAAVTLTLAACATASPQPTPPSQKTGRHRTDYSGGPLPASDHSLHPGRGLPPRPGCRRLLREAGGALR